MVQVIKISETTLERGDVVKVKRTRYRLRSPFQTSEGVDGWWCVKVYRDGAPGEVKPVRVADMKRVK